MCITYVELMKYAALYGFDVSNYLQVYNIVYAICIICIFNISLACAEYMHSECVRNSTTLLYRLSICRECALGEGRDSAQLHNNNNA
jgi:hypothetical protein